MVSRKIHFTAKSVLKIVYICTKRNGKFKKEKRARNGGACLESQHLRTGRQEGQEFKPIFSYIVSSRPGWATEDSDSKNQNKKK